MSYKVSLLNNIIVNRKSCSTGTYYSPPTSCISIAAKWSPLHSLQRKKRERNETFTKWILFYHIPPGFYHWLALQDLPCDQLVMFGIRTSRTQPVGLITAYNTQILSSHAYPYDFLSSLDQCQFPCTWKWMKGTRFR